MNTKNVKGRTKKFLKENGVRIFYYCGGVAIGAVAMYICTKDHLIHWDKDASKMITRALHPCKDGVYGIHTVVSKKPIKLKALGELGKTIVDAGVNPELNTYRFIVIGDPLIE